MTRRMPVEPAAGATATSPSQPSPVDVLILGAGWTSTFLLPLLASRNVAHAATSTTGRDGTIAFRFDPESSDLQPYAALPTACTVLITFPLTGEGQSKRLVDLYTRSRRPADVEGVEGRGGPEDGRTFFIQLGSTGIFTAPHWNTHKSEYNKENGRAQAEDELLSIGLSSSSGTPGVTSAVLNLAGLYGGQRVPKSWLPRVIKKKGDIAGKKALHLVHGQDVARAILAAHEHADEVAGQRWIITDLHVYDWWDLIFDWSGPGEETMSLLVETEGKQGGAATAPPDAGAEPRKEDILMKKAVLEYMEADGVRALPRSAETLGRVVDGRDFWDTVGSWPSVGRVK